MIHLEIEFYTMLLTATSLERSLNFYYEGVGPPWNTE